MPVNEVELCTKMPAVLLGTNSLTWWPEHEAWLSHLSKLARHYVSCSATSSSAERVVSLAGRLYKDYAQSLTELNLEEQMHMRAKVNRVNYESVFR